MSDKKTFSNLEVGIFKKDLSNLVEQISVKLLSLTVESDKEIAIETLTMALLQITAALAVQSECPKDIYLQIAEIGFDGAVKQEAKEIYKDLDFLKNKVKSELN